MKFAYKFSNLLGTVYREGDILFSPDGNSVISPVGNRISIFDLKNNKSKTLPIESSYNYNAIDISPNGCVLIAINEAGDAHIISLISQTIVYRYRFKQKVNAVKFSPDGQYIAACKESNVFIFKAPGAFNGQFNAFVMERVYHGAFDETTCLDWSTDSKLLAVGSKDNFTRIYAVDKNLTFTQYSLSSHTDSIVSCFFEDKSLDITTIAKNGHLCLWECSLDIDSIIKLQSEDALSESKKKRDEVKEEVDDAPLRPIEEQGNVQTVETATSQDQNKIKSEQEKFYYRRLGIRYLLDEVHKDNKNATLSSAAYHKQMKILVTGYTNGAFYIHEMPDVNLIHSLSISEQVISAISLNATGDWIALGCGGLGQLLVWEWQSETYVMKQQGHANNMSCIEYSLDGQHLVTGGEDGKVKLWNIQSGFCIVTFNEHTSPITGLAFSGNKKFVVSASLDGTVRAYDLIRYRNFRTLATPSPVQFACIAIDSSGEFVAAGGQDVFEIFLWSMKMGRLLEVLSGHEGPVWGIAFDPNPASSTLVSVSWDKTLRVWDAIQKGSAHESIDITADGLAVAYKPDGKEVAVATLDGQITVYDVKTAALLHTIEGKNDLGSGRLDADLVTAKQSLKAKSFTTLCYTADGECILAAGQSKNVCIYNVKEAMIIKKFEITQNRSFDGVDSFINRRKLTEFGNVALVEERDDAEGYEKVALKLPGVRKGDMCSRTTKPEVRVFALRFAPTGQQWAACTTEGLLIYSLSTGVVFDPWELQIGITPAEMHKAIANKDYANALIMALKLNEPGLITLAMESVPVSDVQLTVADLSEKCVQKLLQVIANALDTSHHLEFYLNWTQCLLNRHGLKSIGGSAQCLAPLLDLQKSLTRRNEQLLKLCDFNKYTMEYICKLGEEASKQQETQLISAMDEDENPLASDEDDMLLFGEE